MDWRHNQPVNQSQHSVAAKHRSGCWSQPDARHPRERWQEKSAHHPHFSQSYITCLGPCINRVKTPNTVYTLDIRCALWSMKGGRMYIARANHVPLIVVGRLGNPRSVTRKPLMVGPLLTADSFSNLLFSQQITRFSHFSSFNSPVDQLKTA